MRPNPGTWGRTVLASPEQETRLQETGEGTTFEHLHQPRHLHPHAARLFVRRTPRTPCTSHHAVHEPARRSRSYDYHTR